MRDLKEKITYTIFEEIDVYINLVKENSFEDNPHKKGIEEFIINTVIPRFNILRKIISDYKE